MKLRIKLPKKIEKKYYEINSKFSNIYNDWQKYTDEIIPEDEEFAKEITNFIIDVIDYILDNFDSLDIKKYQEFLAYYHYGFFYGPNHDDRNYLEFDEMVNGEDATWFCNELMDEDKLMTKTQLKKIKSKFIKLLKQFQY